MNSNRYSSMEGEKGSAIVLALFVLALISVFVAIAMSRSAAEAAGVGNETAEGRTFYAAQGSLEMMTRNFNKVFEMKLNPTATDLNNIRTGTVPGLPGFTFNQELDQVSTRQNVVLTGGLYSGLHAIRDSWRLRTTATDANGVQVQLTRNLLNSRIPIFQFGIFNDDDLELYRPPRFSFGGRVHTNQNFYISPGTEGVYFDSKVTVSGHVITQTWRNWFTGDSANNQTFIRNASGTFRQLLPTMGSVLNTTVGAANNVFASNPDLPPSRLNTSFLSQAAIFDGNLEHQTKVLRLPLKVGYPTDLVEIVKRPKNIATLAGGDLYQTSTGVVGPVTNGNQDDDILRSERYANKHGIRVTLADSKAKLPGCASGIGVNAVSGPCGVRLDGDSAGQGANPSPVALPTPQRVRGYQPLPMKLSTTDLGWGYVPTRVNGERLHMQGMVPSGRTQEVWIKVELVSINDATQEVITQDVTQDFLSLGVTEEAPASITLNAYSGTRSNNGTATAPSSNLTATTAQTPSTYPDSRSIIKIQRFTIPGPAIPGSNNVLLSYGSGATAESVVRRFTAVGTSDANVNNGCTSGCTAANLAMVGDSTVTFAAEMERFAHLKRATVNGTSNVAIVPFPIKMFDTREGTYFDERSTTYYSNLNNVTRNGVMSVIDIDVANLRRFLRGDFNGLFPTNTPYAVSNSGVGLRNIDVPQREGWVFYVSDRRGDADFDGELDMEDIYSAAPGNGGTLQPGEDINNSGALEARYFVSPVNASANLLAETERYNTNAISPDLAAVVDHRYYRRGVRLINATVVPGVYDSATPANTRGISFASENGLYIKGNFNATGVSSVPATGNTPFDNYLPFNSATHIPSSIVADGVTILSNAWVDGASFSSPYDQANRLATTTQMRFALISGDTITSRETSPNQGGISPNLNGGVHNFKRFLERWTSQRLDYSGSLINLYNSRNNNGSFKCCNTVYNPPIRNWVFDSTFLDPSRLPPGTPFFQYVQTTGFHRTNS